MLFALWWASLAVVSAQPEELKPEQETEQKACCSTLAHYEEALYTPLENKYQQCRTESSNLKTEVGALEEALQSTNFIPKVASQDIKPPTLDRLISVQKNIISRVQNVKLNMPSTRDDTFPTLLPRDESPTKIPIDANKNVDKEMRDGSKVAQRRRRSTGKSI